MDMCETKGAGHVKLLVAKVSVQFNLQLDLFGIFGC